MIDSAAQFLLPLASWVLFASLKSLVVVPLVLVMRRLCARWLTPQGRYGLWFALLACLAIPFGGKLEIGKGTYAPAPAPVQVVTPAVVPSRELPIIRIDAAAVAAVPELSMASKAVLVWLLGAAGLAGVVGHNVHRYRRIRRRAANVDAATNELFRSCKRVLQLRRRVGLFETAEVASPQVVGYWRPTLLLPRALSTQISNEQLRLVLLHELAHVRRHDILVNWLVTLVQILHWFNPLAWYALRIMRNDMEHACDASVLGTVSANERGAYGDTLIRLSDLSPRRTLLAQNAGMVESIVQLKARISMIAQFKPADAASSLVAAVLITLTCSIAVTQAAGRPRPASTAAQSAPATAAKPAAPAPPTAASPPATSTTAAATPTAQRPAKAAQKAATKAPALESAQFQIRYATAKELAEFVKSAPGIGLLSFQGSVAVDERSNTLFVQDSASNVVTIRQLVARLDVPLQQVAVTAIFAVVDNDLLQELTAGKIPGGSWSPATDLGPDQAIAALLDAGQQANRVQIISEPKLLIANRTQASIDQSAGLPANKDAAPGSPPANMRLNLAVTPTMRPDNRVMLAIDARMDMISTVVVTTGGVRVPSIDTREVKNQLVLDYGTTAMLDVVEGSASSLSGVGAGRRLVAFVTPSLLPEVVAPR